MKQSQLILIGIIALVVLGGGYMLLGNKQTSMEESKSSTTLQESPTQETTQPSGAMGEQMMKEKAIAMDEIAQHNKKEDCWFAIDNVVYNVTQYIADEKHPGKDAIVQGCGKDATELFETRPMGSGTEHSSKARSFLPNFKIGVLAQ